MQSTEWSLGNTWWNTKHSKAFCVKSFVMHLSPSNNFEVTSCSEGSCADTLPGIPVVYELDIPSIKS